jgi:hypothetical protein
MQRCIRYGGYYCCWAWLLLAAGCATSPPSNFYALSSQVEPPSNAAVEQACRDVVVSVGPVVLPEFLLRPQIVTRASAHRLDFDEFHRWAGNLDANFERVLLRNLSVLLGTEQVIDYSDADKYQPQYRIQVTVDQFDGKLGGDVTLTAGWTLIDVRNGVRAQAYRAEIHEAATDAHIESLVSAESAALATFSRTIAAEVTKRCAAVTATHSP